MAISYQTISTVATKTTTTVGSLTLNSPSGATTDDLLIACISFRGATIPSIPSGWTIVNRTTVTGNTATNQTAIASGLMAYIKRGATAPSFIFGATAGQQFPDLALGYVVRLSGQELTDPLAGTSVNTLASGSSGQMATGGYVRSITTQTPSDYIEIMLCMGGQEVTWSSQQYGIIGGLINNPFTSEIGELTSTSGADGSIAVAYGTANGNTQSGFVATTSAINARHSLMVATFAGPKAPTTNYSFSMLF